MQSLFYRLLVKISLERSYSDGKYYIIMQEDFYQPEVRRASGFTVDMQRVLKIFFSFFSGHRTPRNTPSGLANCLLEASDGVAVRLQRVRLCIGPVHASAVARSRWDREEKACG